MSWPFINEWKRRDLHVGALGLEALAAETHTFLSGFLKGPQIPAESVRILLPDQTLLLQQLENLPPRGQILDGM